MTDHDDWRQWREARLARLRRPHGILALVGTHWLGEEPAPILEGEPVLWSGDATTVTVTAKAEHGLFLDGQPIDGTVTLFPDTAPEPSTITAGQYRLVPIEREGVPALRVYDSEAPTRHDFLDVATFDFAPQWVRPARFVRYADQRTESVLNADGVHRGLSLVGTVEFTVPDQDPAAAEQTLSLAVEADEDGTLNAVFADATSGKSTYRFRFLTFPAPAPDGATVADFNRAYLPPCAFTEHYLCPVPPTGNTLPAPIEAGEQSVQTR